MNLTANGAQVHGSSSPSTKPDVAEEVAAPEKRTCLNRGMTDPVLLQHAPNSKVRMNSAEPPASKSQAES